MILHPSHPVQDRIIRHAHIACGIGAGARGFNRASARVGNLRGRFQCVGGIDVDAGAIRNFGLMTGVPGTVMDLFDEEQYRAFHGKAPPAGWKAAVPDDIHRTFGPKVDILFASYPCKGFSGLLSNAQSLTDKYQALNALTLRGMWLALEAYKHDPIPIIIFENVPRIQTRGRWLLDQICALYRSYGYNVAESVHDCGEVGGLAQSRKRFLLIMRHRDKIPNFIYEPVKHRLRGVGEVIGKLPLPGDARGGPMHRVPALQWKTWVRLAFVPAGKDWRALNDLAVENGVLRDFGIVPDRELRDGVLGVMGWGDSAGTIVGNQRSPLHGRHSVADPRPMDAGWQADVLGVRDWEQPTGVVPGRSSPTNGAHSVADPRTGDMRSGGLGVLPFDETAGTVAGESLPTNGRFAIADPRVDGHPKSVQLGVRGWEQTAPCVKGDMSVGTGPYAVSDPRFGDRTPFNNVFRIVPYDDPSPAVAGPGGPVGGLAVADPRPPEGSYKQTKYKVTPFDGTAGAVISASTTGTSAFAVADPRGGQDPAQLHGKYPVEEWAGDPSRAVIGGRDNGAFAVADPRPTHGPNAHTNKMRVVSADAPAPAVIGSDRVGSGALSVADPRPLAFRDGRTNWKGTEHYGVIGWEASADPVTGSGKHDNGRNSVADPRDVPPEPLEVLPSADDRLVCRIIARDGTWHRPFTTLELAALQSLFDPEEAFSLEGKSDAMMREWIGNAVPSEAARGMAEVMGEAILLADLGETFTLSSRDIWVAPHRISLAVDTDQEAWRL